MRVKKTSDRIDIEELRFFSSIIREIKNRPFFRNFERRVAKVTGTKLTVMVYDLPPYLQYLTDESKKHVVATYNKSVIQFYAARMSECGCGYEEIEWLLAHEMYHALLKHGSDCGKSYDEMEQEVDAIMVAEGHSIPEWSRRVVE